MVCFSAMTTVMVGFESLCTVFKTSNLHVKTRIKHYIYQFIYCGDDHINFNVVQKHVI